MFFNVFSVLSHCSTLISRFYLKYISLKYPFGMNFGSPHIAVEAESKGEVRTRRDWATFRNKICISSMTSQLAPNTHAHSPNRWLPPAKSEENKKLFTFLFNYRSIFYRFLLCARSRYSCSSGGPHK